MDMNRVVESSTESAEEVSKALGFKTEEVESKNDGSVSDEKSEETTEESETSETEDGADEESEQESKPKKKGGFQKRISKLTAEKEQLRQEIEKLKASQTANKNDGIKEDKEPSSDDFESYADYSRALARYEARQLLKEEKQREINEKIQNIEIEKQKTFSERYTKAQSEIEDFDEVMESVSSVFVPQQVVDALKESEFGPQLIYEIAKDAATLERLQKLSPYQAILELGKIEAKLSAKTSSEVKKKTSAPPPLKPLTQTSKSSVEKNPYEHEMSYAEFKKWEAKQI